MVYCKACGYELTDPGDELHDPEGLSDVAKQMGGPVENPDTAHLVVRDGEKGWRYYCSENGQVTSVVSDEPTEGEGGEQQSEPQPEPNAENKGRRAEKGEVYDLREDKSSKDVMVDVASAPFLDLSDSQVAELEDWCDDYNGQIPPDIFGDILENFSGVQKQTAKLAKQKYEVKLNKWVKRQTSQSDGPPIGITQQPTPGGDNGGGGRRRRPQQPNASGGGNGQQTPQDDSSGGQQPQDQNKRRRGGGRDVPSTPQDMRERRRYRRLARRNDAMDRAVAKMADEAAEDVAREMTGFIGDARDIIYSAVKKKVEKDPDWLFEKANAWDIDIMDVMMEPSEARKEEMKKDDSAPEVDQEIDSALEGVGSTEQPTEPPAETPNTDEAIPDDGELNTTMENEEPDEEDELFEEQFGDLEVGGGD